jgi:ABC-type multidrug transport system fused ATPase/permease subunit
MSALTVLRRLASYMRPHKRAAALTVLFAVAGFLLSFAYPWIIGNVVDLVLAPPGTAATASERTGELAWLAALGVLTAIGHAVVVFGRGHANVHLGHGIVVDIRRRVFEHLQGLSVLFFSKERTGSILARMMHDVHEATALVYMGLIVAAVDVLQLLCAFVLLVSISWKLTLACAVLFPLYGLVFVVMNPRVRAASERMHGQLTRISGNVAEQLAGQALVKIYTAEEREARRFAADVAYHHHLVTAQSKEGHLVSSYGEVLVHIGTTIVFGYGGWLALQGEMTAGTMTRFLGYVLVMFGPIRRFADLNVVYQTSLSAMRRVFGLLDIEPSVPEPKYPRLEPPKVGHVRFEDVRFRYDDDCAEGHARLDADDASRPPPSSRGHLRALPPPSPWVIDGVTFEAKPGEIVAVVGPPATS